MDWPKFLQEINRVTRPGGVIRLTEAEGASESNSQALMCLYEILTQAFHQAGHSFTPTGKGLIDELVRMQRQSGLQHIQTCSHTQEYRAGTLATQRFFEDAQLIFRTIAPFLRKWAPVSDDYDALYQQAMHDMQQPDFQGEWHIYTIWGIK